MTTKFSNPFGCVLPEWLFPFARKHASILKAVDVCSEHINGLPTPNVADIQLTFFGVSDAEVAKLLDNKGSRYFGNKGEIVVWGYNG
jgi:hypothetical protein